MSVPGWALTSSTINGVKYTHPAKYRSSDYHIFNGLDVSYWQYNITQSEWNQIKAAGVDYVFIRCGYTSYDGFRQNKDSYFERNVERAYKAGVNVGIYYWSEATTESEAKKEAAYVNSLLKKYRSMITMPVAMDYEFASGYRSTKKFNSMSKSAARKQFTSNAVAFMKAIKGYGYTPLFYSYRGLVDPSFNSNYKMDMTRINGNGQYRFWLAQYSSDNSYSGEFEFWQHTSSGRVSGIDGRCDRNFWYYNNAKEKTLSGTVSLKNCKVTMADSALYTGKKVEPNVTVKDGDKTLKEGEDYQVLYMNNIKKGTARVIIRGIGDYSNDVLKSFKITGNDLSDAEVSGIEDKVYTGAAITQSPKVTYKKKTLKVNTDYTLTYKNNKNVGKATVIVKGKKNYAGKVSKTFQISKGTGQVTTPSDTYTLEEGNTAELGASTIGGKLTYKSSDSKVATVSTSGVIKALSAGNASVVISSAASSNVTSAKKTVSVIVKEKKDTLKAPAVPKLKKLVNLKDGKYRFKAVWTNVSGESGYVIKYSASSNMKNAVKVTVTGSNVDRKTIKSKFGSKKIYVKVRAYAEKNGKKAYSKYSEKKSLVMKKK